jgi:hypothetical protein
MAQMDYPGDDYKQERQWFEFPVWVECLLFGVMVGLFWFLAVCLTDGGLAPLLDLVR